MARHNHIEKVLDTARDGWSSLMRDWDRSLRSGNYPATTRYNYLLAAGQLANYIEAGSPAFDDPTAVTRTEVENFQAWMIETRSAATAVNKYKALQQFFRWLVEEEELDHSPLARVRQPKAPQKLIPLLSDDDTAEVLAACKGRDFADVRDQAIIRLLYNTGARLSEVAQLHVTDVDLKREVVRLRGKGAKDRQVRFGPKTARAISRYLRVRADHRDAMSDRLWLAVRGGAPLSAKCFRNNYCRFFGCVGVMGLASASSSSSSVGLTS